PTPSPARGANPDPPPRARGISIAGRGRGEAPGAPSYSHVSQGIGGQVSFVLSRPSRGRSRRRRDRGEAPPHARDRPRVSPRAGSSRRQRAGVDVVMAIAVVGSLGLDTIQTPAGRVEDVLGGSAAYFALAARHFLPVSIVAVVGSDFPAEARLALEHPDLDLSGIEVSEGKTFRWEGVYSTDMNTRETLRTELNVFEQFRPKLHDRLRAFTEVFLANI